MASATAVLWAFNFILSFSWPPLLKAFKPQGAFGWYAAWCAILWLLGKYKPEQHLHGCPSDRSTVLLLFPETKELTLEELDNVFGISTRKQILHGLREPPYWINKYILRRDVKLEPLVDIKKLRGITEEEDEKVGTA